MRAFALILLLVTPLWAQDDKDTQIKRLTNRISQLQLNLHNQKARADRFELMFLRLQIAFSDSVNVLRGRMSGIYNDAALILGNTAIWPIADTLLARYERGMNGKHRFRTIVERRNGMAKKE